MSDFKFEVGDYMDVAITSGVVGPTGRNGNAGGHAGSGGGIRRMSGGAADVGRMHSSGVGGGRYRD